MCLLASYNFPCSGRVKECVAKIRPQCSHREYSREGQDRPLPPDSCFLKGSHPHSSILLWQGRGRAEYLCFSSATAQYSCAHSRVPCALHTAKTCLCYSQFFLHRLFGAGLLIRAFIFCVTQHVCCLYIYLSVCPCVRVCVRVHVRACAHACLVPQKARRGYQIPLGLE